MSIHSRARALGPTLMVVVCIALAAFASATPTLAQSTDGGGGDGFCAGGFCIGSGAGTWLQDTINHIVTDFVSGLAKDLGGAIVGFIGDVNFLTRTPENLSYNNDLVKQFTTAAQVLADGLLAVVVLVGGYNIMLRPFMGSTYAGALEFLPRLLLGGILINTAAWWCRLAIDVNNAACGVFGAPNIGDVVSGVLRVTGDQIAGLLMVLIVVVMAILLTVQQLMRLALVDVLLILAPLAPCCGSYLRHRPGPGSGADSS